jgi:signal transduction histidine kinase
LSVTDEGPEGVLLSVRDHGPGIPPDELERVFEPFVQSSRTRDGSGGTGLGLTICRKIVTAHGGSIEADNAEGGGTVIHLRLPPVVFRPEPAVKTRGLVRAGHPAPSPSRLELSPP